MIELVSTAAALKSVDVLNGAAGLQILTGWAHKYKREL